MTIGQVSVVCFLLVLFTVITLIFMIATRAGKIKDKPLDDSKWQLNDESLNAVKRKHLAHKQETFEGMLGKSSVIKVVEKNSCKQGFCFVTNKAYYFIGNIYQKFHGLFYRKTDIQHRINADELKGVKVERIFLFRTLLFFIISLFNLYFDIRIDILFGEFGENVGATIADIGVVIVLAFFISQILCLILIIINLINMVSKRRTILCFEFVSQTIQFPVGILGKQEIKDFYNTISRVQKIVQNDVQKDIANKNVSNSLNVTTTSNKIEQLKELSALHEQGAIGTEEFETLKAELIGNKLNALFCPKCSVKLSDGAEFCSNCGCKL